MLQPVKIVGVCLKWDVLFSETSNENEWQLNPSNYLKQIYIKQMKNSMNQYDVQMH